MWLPLGARWSLDARRHVERPAQQSVLSGASAALLLQVALIYVTSALLKTDPVWWKTGEAVRQVFSLGGYARSLAITLSDYPTLLRAATYGILLFELLGPLIALLPLRNPRWRVGMVLGFIGFHLGLALTLRLGIFPFVGIAGWLPFIPGAFWWWVGGGERDDKDAPALQQWRVVDGVVLILFAIAALSALRPWFPKILIGPLQTISSALRIEQQWNLFAPRPIQREGWFVVVGFFGGDREVDLLTGREPVWTEPRPLCDLFPNERWRRYGSRVREGKKVERLRAYADWVHRDFARRFPDHAVLDQVSVYGVTVSIHNRSEVHSQELYVWPEDLANAPVVGPAIPEEVPGL